MNTLSHRTFAKVLVDFSFNITVEIDYLAYLKEPFKATGNSADNNYSVKRLASLDVYLAQGFSFSQAIFTLIVISAMIEVTL